MRLPDFAAQGATRSFSAGLYQEHLEEASFLYQHIGGLYDDPAVTWLEIRDFEERLEAHIDALVLGEETAVEICRRHAEEGDPGEVYAAVCVFCRSGRCDLLRAVLKGLDQGDELRSQAVSDAMKDEMPTEWAEMLIASLARGDQSLIPMLAHYLGYWRLAAGRELDMFIDRVSAKGLARLMWGLGRVGVDRVAAQVLGYVGHEDAAVRTNSLMALLRRGDDDALVVCRNRALLGDPAMYLPLAVSGKQSDAALLQKTYLTQTVTPEALIALGIIGDFGAVAFLVDQLTHEELAAGAAAALRLITGAELCEEAFIPDEVDEDELFEEERQTYRETGAGPKHTDNRPFGVSLRRTSQNRNDWLEWLQQHSSDFDPTLRYRLGKPFSLRSVVDTLASPFCRRPVRTLAHEELVIRYGINVAFEAEMRVSEQENQIKAIAALCGSREGSFLPGQWYFSGALV